MFGVGSALSIFSAFFISVALVPALAVPARHIGLIDQPDHRKRHSTAVPVTGGLAMFVAFLAAMMLNVDATSEHLSLVAGMAVLMTVGVVDDLIDVRAAFKLLVQVAVACMAVLVGGLELHNLGQLFGPAFGTIGLGPFSSLFTIVCIVFMVNVFNMCDGLDGLAGGTGLIVLLLLAVAASLDGSTSLVLVSLTLATATLGFLIWNMRLPFRKNASAFMGDAGSMMLGFAIAWLAISVATAEGSSVYPVSVAWLLLIPCVDTLAVSIRRMKMRRSPMSADRSHMHHILRRCHLTTSTAVGTIHLGVLGSGLFGIIGWHLGWPQWILFILAIGLAATYITMLLNAHKIIRLAGRRKREG